MESNELNTVADSLGNYAVVKESALYEKAYKFAIRVIKAYQYLAIERQEAVLAKHLLKSGSAIGAKVAEANGAISKADFVAKISIAYNECIEIKYWLSLLKDTDFIEEKVYQSMFVDADELGQLLFAILKTTKRVNSNE
jgi:four helix bundle protein